MMTTFDDRENAFENKFAHDAEMQFKAEARRNKLLGLWAAEKMGHADPDAYAKEVIAADFEEVGGRTAVVGDRVHAGHGEAGAVRQHADGSERTQAVRDANAWEADKRVEFFREKDRRVGWRLTPDF